MKALLAALVLAAPLASANPVFQVNAGTGADLVIAGNAGTIDTEAVPPSGSGNLYAKLNGGPFLNSGNTNASLAYSFEIHDGDVLALHRESFGITATSIYGFDLISGDGTTRLYDGAVGATNGNLGAPAIASGASREFTDPHDGSTWRITFTAATADSANLVYNLGNTPGQAGDRIDTLTFSLVATPNSALEVAEHVRKTSDGSPVAITIPVTNTGTAQPLQLTTVTPGGSGAAAFVVESFPASLAPGGSGNITLTFTPDRNGPTHCHLTIASNDPVAPEKIVSVRVDTDDPARTVSAATALWTRLVGPEVAGRFDFSHRPSIDGKDTYELSVVGGRVKVAGSSGVGIARGAYDYIRSKNYGQIGWTGTRVALPETLADQAAVVVTPPGPLQTYFNPVVFGYTTPFWDWQRWEREIDLMAIHGLNLPLALNAQEAISERVWLKMGFTQQEIDTFEVGPAHLPWQRLGCIVNHDGELPPAWHAGQVALQHQMLERMRELGIQPVAPAFAGFVPAAISRLYPDADIHLTNWNSGFPASKRPWFLLPTDPRFAKIQASFLHEWRDEFGAADYFICDSFNELDVPTNGGTLAGALADYGERIFNSIQGGAGPDAVWFLQGWMFGYQRNIWSDTTVSALLSRLPDDGVLIQDSACDYNANVWGNGMNWKVFNGFHNKRWMHCVIPNMGSKTALTGVLSFYAADAPATLADPARGRLSGAGYAGEGLENNEVIFELVANAAWADTPLDLDEWIRNYCKSRYGACPPAMEQAWTLLRQTVYGSFTPHPSLGWQTGGPGFGSVNRDNRIQQAVTAFLSCRGTLGDEPLYQADAIEFTAFALGIHADSRFVSARNAFTAGDITLGESYLDQGLDLLDQLDRLLASHPLMRLDRWLGDARARGTTTAESDAYEANARRIITSWGPPVNDYACRIWSGLVRDFYKPRMEAWFAAWRAGQSFNKNAWEQQWISSNGISAVTPYADPVESAAALLADAIAAGGTPGNTTEVIGDWVPGDLSTAWTDLEWTLSGDQLDRLAGVVFQYLSGADRLAIRRVEIIADGQVIAALDQDGLAGDPAVNHIYRLDVPPGNAGNNGITLRASVRGDGGTDSRGQVLLLSNIVAGAAVVKEPTGSALADGASWTGGSAPDDTSIATWTTTSLGAGLSLAAAAAWQGIAIESATSDISISGPGILTLGPLGIDLSSSNRNLSISAPLHLFHSQSWTVLAGRTLVVGDWSGAGTLNINGVARIAEHPFFLPSNGSAVTAFPDAALGDITAITGSIGGGWVNNGTPLAGTVFHRSDTAGAIEFQFQCLESNYTKGLKIRLEQVGPDITARVLYAKYITTVNLGFNFDTGGTSTSIAGSSTANGYGVAELQLTLGTATSAGIRFTGAGSTSGNLVLQDAAATFAPGSRFTSRLTNTGANAITGSGTLVFDGDLAIDSAAVTVTSGMWLLENVASLAGPYGSTFRVVTPAGIPWTDAGNQRWTYSDHGRNYQFDEMSGILSLSTPGFAAWAAANASNQAMNDDHDHDGVANGIEYFLGESGSGATLLPTLVNGSIRWTIGASYPGFYGVHFLLQTSENLAAWSDVPITDVILTPDSLSFRPPAGNSGCFIRLKLIEP